MPIDFKRPKRSEQKTIALARPAVIPSTKSISAQALQISPNAPAWFNVADGEEWVIYTGDAEEAFPYNISSCIYLYKKQKIKI
ncbi:hypothetical protein BIY26_23030 [Brenneria goodwinii]|uniref:Uncharacterized protein n=1 Tax=Brenneria goodwinii TaxID=1109412 RepID=A0AAE8EK44_9GAMM|nr:hypothetical protein AWC36_18580 [Brenneria goodwinii]RLM15521.1 hypothetical protein BIY26_23030 [Brenneria goodwinii]